MPDNQPSSANPSPAAFFALQDHAVLALDGPDAVAFAQAQFANDVAALATGHWQWNAWLTPKGRVLVVFALLRTGAEALRLLVPDADVEALGESLRRMVFRRKLAVGARPDLHAAGAFAAPAHARGAVLAGAEDTAMELDYGAPGLPRTLRLSAAVAPADAAAHARWGAADLRLGLPRLPESQRGQWTPQQLGLDRLRAYSVKKGCYPGQEIVARTHFLGRAKREAMLLLAAAPVQAGGEVVQAGQAIGHVASVAGGAGPLALVVLPLERGPEPLQVDGVDATPQPFLDGLAR